jgi:hypothetical protein
MHHKVSSGKSASRIPDIISIVQSQWISKLSISISDPKLPLHIDLSHPTGVSYETHQTLSDVLDLVVVMEQTNMAFDRSRGIISLACQHFSVSQT